MRRYLHIPLFVLVMLGTAWGQTTGTPGKKSRAGTPRPPNFIVIFADDLGYGDLGLLRASDHPHASPGPDGPEGMRFTQFYVAAPVCTQPGCIAHRTLAHSQWHVRQAGRPVSQPAGGLPGGNHHCQSPQGETIRHACIGSGTGAFAGVLAPNRHGFDFYFGIPYSTT